MKTTIKLSREKGITVAPTNLGRVLIGMATCPGMVAEKWEGFADLTPDQAGALIFGLEQALEAAGIRRDQAVMA